MAERKRVNTYSRKEDRLQSGREKNLLERGISRKTSHLPGLEGEDDLYFPGSKQNQQ